MLIINKWHTKYAGILNDLGRCINTDAQFVLLIRRGGLMWVAE